MSQALTDQQIVELRQYWDSSEFGRYDDPLYKALPAKERQALDRAAVRQIASLQHQSEEDFRRRTLRETERGPTAHSVWGGQVARMAVENFKMAVDGRLEAVQEIICRQVCVKLRYCEKRKKGTLEKEGVNLAIAVADALLSIATHIPLPLTLVSVYLVKRGVLDRWCNCQPSA